MSSRLSGQTEGLQPAHEETENVKSDLCTSPGSHDIVTVTWRSQFEQQERKVKREKQSRLTHLISPLVVVLFLPTIHVRVSRIDFERLLLLPLVFVPCKKPHTAIVKWHFFSEIRYSKSGKQRISGDPGLVVNAFLKGRDCVVGIEMRCHVGTIEYPEEDRSGLPVNAEAIVFPERALIDRQIVR
jgi:hypothetical protein